MRPPSPPATLDPAVLERRRRAVARTAWTITAIAVGIYLAFIASGVFGGGR